MGTSRPGRSLNWIDPVTASRPISELILNQPGIPSGSPSGTPLSEISFRKAATVRNQKSLRKFVSRRLDWISDNPELEAQVFSILQQIPDQLLARDTERIVSRFGEHWDSLDPLRFRDEGSDGVRANRVRHRKFVFDTQRKIAWFPWNLFRVDAFSLAYHNFVSPEEEDHFQGNSSFTPFDFPTGGGSVTSLAIEVAPLALDDPTDGLFRMEVFYDLPSGRSGRSGSGEATFNSVHFSELGRPGFQSPPRVDGLWKE